MKGSINETTLQPDYGPTIPGQERISKDGIRIKKINGEDYFEIEDINRVLIDQISKLPKTETRPMVQAAQDARTVIDELLHGLGGDMEKFQVNAKHYLEDIRQTRFAVVTETSAMVNPLKDVRQFFLGNDYKEEINRLKEFVDLCERLQKLKASGFLDTIADTMLRLDSK